jgi:hypothetical protein
MGVEEAELLSVNEAFCMASTPVTSAASGYQILPPVSDNPATPELNPKQICGMGSDHVARCVPNPYYQPPQTPKQMAQDLGEAAVLMVPGLGPEGFVAKEVGGETAAAGGLALVKRGVVDALSDGREVAKRFTLGAVEGAGGLAFSGIAAGVAAVIQRLKSSATAPSPGTTQSPRPSSARGLLPR